MKAIILAAGKGTRLRPITETRPKPLVPIACKPLIDWIIEALLKINHIDEIVVVISYMRDKIIEHVRKRFPEENIVFVDQGEELGTGDAILKAIEKTDTTGRTLIIYGDIFLKDWRILEEISKNNKDLIVASTVSNPENYGVLIIENGVFKGVVEKPANPPSNLINAGIYLLNSDDIVKYSGIEPSPRGEIEFTDILNNLSRETEIHVYNLGEKSWIDIGMPWNLLEANKMALEEMESEIKGVVEPNVYIKGKVIIDENAHVKAFTYIEGPVYIARNAVIGPNARIRPYTSICEGSRIGFSVEVKESIIMEHTHISHLAYIGDSIICENVNFGAGTITANLRFDDKPVKMNIKGKRISSGRRKLGAVVGAGVKTGINVSLMPGVKIGSYSWIAPGAVVYSDIPSRSFYKWRGEAYIEPLKENHIHEKAS